MADTLRWLEKETAFARVGDAGEQQIETRGFLATAFDHRDSRAGDPDLHTHVAVSNKVRARDDHADGRPRWLSLDARVIHAAAVAASERYNTRFEDALVRRLGVKFAARSDSVRDEKRVIREIVGVPEPLIKHFSKRRASIEDRYAALAAEFRSAHGHEPPRETQLKLAQQATLETRDGKPPPQSLVEKLSEWCDEAAATIGGSALEAMDAQATGHPAPQSSPSDPRIDELAARAVARVSQEKATWTRWNLLAEVERQMRPLRYATPSERQAATDRVLARALDPDMAVRLTSEGRDHEIDPLNTVPVAARSDGESVLHEHGATRYTTQDLLDAEQRLLSYATQRTRYGLSSIRLLEFIGSFEQRHGLTLDEGQRALALGFAADPRRLVAGIGPAGAGKTTAMRLVAEAWRTTGRRVIPLAPSAAAAEVLGDELSCRAENLHKFHHAHHSKPTDAPADPWFVLEPGDLVLVDEAGMAGTRNLDWLTHYARERGAVVRLLGDPAQLSSVEAGGMLQLLAQDVGAVELTDLHRFADPDEAAAIIGIRESRPEALDFYFEHERIQEGAAGQMLDTAYLAWLADVTAGRSTLLIAHSRTDVTTLNRRARKERVALGQVSSRGVELHDGTEAGVGDTVVTRRNDRRLTDRRGSLFVRNGDAWTVTEQHRNGDLTVTRANRICTKVRLPREYVESNVELGYATTTAQAQGRTVDTAHVLVDNSMTRESVYVATTRARDNTQLYVSTEDLLDLDAERPPRPRANVRDQLEHLIRRQTTELTATDIARVSRMQKAQPRTPTSRSRRAFERSRPSSLRR